jgi:hypothetical protein
MNLDCINPARLVMRVAWLTASFAGVGPQAMAQTPGPWQEANKAVAAFPRGHADVLRWEKPNTPQALDAPAHPESGKLTLAQAMRWAQQDQPQWIKPGMSAQDMAEARQQAAALRWEVQKLWVDAVASRQSVAHRRNILALAEAGAELGQRMAGVGNWSRARQIQEELPLWEARNRLDQAQWQAERALLALWQRIGAGRTVQAVASQLPLHLPPQGPVLAKGGDAPEVIAQEVVLALQTQALQANLRWPLEDLRARRLMAGLGLSAADLQAAQQALSAQAEQDEPVWNPRIAAWGHAFENAWQANIRADRLARQVRADVQVALSAYQLAHHAARTSQAEVVRLHTELSQETLLRYNGMLQSTWDLLASARSRIDKVDDALQAQRQTWLAHADLMAVLAGLPYNASADALDASVSSKPSTVGH